MYITSSETCVFQRIAWTPHRFPFLEVHNFSEYCVQQDSTDNIEIVLH